MRFYYLLWCRLDKRDVYLIWYSNTNDGLVVDRAKRIFTFRSKARLREFARLHGWNLVKGKAILHNLDRVQHWLKKPTRAAIKCNHFLTAWNLFLDVASSIGNRYFSQSQKRARRIYMKLFWGNNLPAVTPPGGRYDPVWTGEEGATLREILGNGLKMFRTHLRSVDYRTGTDTRRILRRGFG